jgi:segregation and condensation protein A
LAETEYSIQLPVFEGPLDLLLGLIEREELDITKVALAQVTDQYLEYIRHLPEHRLEDLASFLIIAARLLQIKSEALLPRPPEREPGEEDPGDALARQLIVYKKFKQIAELLEARQERRLQTYPRFAPAPLPEPKLDLEGISLQDLRQVYVEALSYHAADTPINQVVTPPKVKIRDKILQIVNSLKTDGKTSFWHLISETRSRIEIIILFFAILELIKQEQITIHQEEPFADIEISPGDAWRRDQDFEFDLEFDT